MKAYLISFREDDLLTIMVINAYSLEDAEKFAKDLGTNAEAEELHFNEDVSQKVQFYVGD
jgi:hypothetical protein